MSLQIYLYTITFLDSLCLGFTMPVFPPYLLTLGSTHLHLGFMTVFHLALQLISDNLIVIFCNRFGQKVILIGTLFLSLISNVLLAFYFTPITLIIIRMIFSLTNHTQTLSKLIIAENLSNEEHKTLTMLSVFDVTGFVIGPIIGGYIFNEPDGFFTIIIIVSLLYFLSIVVACNLNILNIQNNNIIIYENYINNSLEKILTWKRNCNEILDTFDKRIIFLYFIYCSCVTAFFSKFPTILVAKYQSNAIIIGCVVSYQIILMFLSSFLISFIKETFYADEVTYINRLKHGLLIYVLSSVSVCFAPIYDIYLLMLIPMLISRTVLDATWEDFFTFKLQDSMTYSAANIVHTMSSLTVPPLIGQTIDNFGYIGLIILSIIPNICVITWITTNEDKFSTKKLHTGGTPSNDNIS